MRAGCSGAVRGKSRLLPNTAWSQKVGAVSLEVCTANSAHLMMGQEGVLDGPCFLFPTPILSIHRLLSLRQAAKVPHGA